ncbi:MAG: hypothetical protein FRX49_12669 [Trebouxia sp. A1-2]|nr:MAG: hypothetical protein FRX49_12669 [Trebouxia sp. A1-2]
MPVSTSEIFSFQVAVGLSLKQNTPLKDEFSYLQVIRKYAEPGYSRSTNEGVTTSHDWQFLHILSGTTKGVYQTPEWVPVKETTIDKKIEFAWIKWTIAIEVNIRAHHDAPKERMMGYKQTPYAAIWLFSCDTSEHLGTDLYPLVEPHGRTRLQWGPQYPSMQLQIRAHT